MLRRLTSVRRLMQRRWVSDEVRDSFHIIPMGKSDTSMATTVSFLTKDMNESKLVGIRGLSSVGFRLFDGSFLYGPIAVFPKMALSWRVLTPDHITPESLELFFMLQPKIDILVLGVGERKDLDAIRERIAPVLKEHNIGLEIMPTEDAISTFNFLNSEMRYVAAALFPPRDLTVTEEENSQAMNYLRDYFEMDEHPLFSGLTKNLANPTEDLVRRIWGKPEPQIVEQINRIAAETVLKKADRIRGIKHDVEPQKITEGNKSDKNKQIDDK